ncbi:MAG: BldC family transcriptional regulator [Actinomycetota bacterium]|nr:BldC family transcriptional regulator [Actinomycetota bacterium]
MSGYERDEKLLSPSEVARLFGVHPKTIARWADAGQLTPYRTLGGHRRYRVGEVEALLRRQKTSRLATAEVGDRARWSWEDEFREEW